MTHVRKGQVTACKEWAKHLRPWWKRHFAKTERKAAKALAKAQT